MVKTTYDILFQPNNRQQIWPIDQKMYFVLYLNKNINKIITQEMCTVGTYTTFIPLLINFIAQLFANLNYICIAI